MAGFKNGSLSLKGRLTSGASEIGHYNLNFSPDGVPYVVDESGIVNQIQPFSTGIINNDIPELIRTNNNIIVPEIDVAIYSTPDYRGIIYKKHISSASFSVPNDGSNQYVVVDWNNGLPEYRLISNKFLINQSNVVACYVVWNTNSNIHAIGFDNKGEGLANKLDRSIIDTTPYRRTLDGGLIISEDGSRHILITSAVVYAGTTPNIIYNYNSLTDYITETYHSSGNWTFNRTSGAYDNIRYDNGTDLVSASNNKYIVRWIYRSIGDDKEIFLVYGTGSYNSITVAQNETVPIVPNVVLNHCMLVGRIIVQYGSSSGLVESAFYDAFKSTGISNHNDLSNIQGGSVSASEYYHIDQLRYGYISTISANVQNQLSALSASTVSNNRIVSATSGLVGGGSLSANISIGLSLIGTSGTYTKINTDIYGRVISGGFLTSSDIPNLGAIRITPSKFLITIPSNVWTINHGLDRYPNFSTRITTTGYEGYRLEPTVLYNDENTMTLTWSQNFTGAVHLI